jgi:tetratricopeptide (TPR) repeat protein
MESEAIDWDQDLPLDADEVYRSLVRSLRRTDGFALLFVRCSPVLGDRIITDVRTDLPSKTVEVLELKESIDNLYDHVAALPNREQINVLFIKGIEYSIFAYEDREMNDVNLRSQSSVYGGTWQGIPRILGHLNLSRERFRDDFKFCFVFLLPEFALRYFIRRAPDFFDWRSNIYEFPTEREVANQVSYQLLSSDKNYLEQLKKNPFQYIEKLVSVTAYIDEDLEPEVLFQLWCERAVMYGFDKKHKKSISSYNKALQLKPEDYNVHVCIGLELFNLGKRQECITYLQKAIEINPKNHLAWGILGYALSNLGRNEEAIRVIDKAIQLNHEIPDLWDTQNRKLAELWNTRGYALANLGRYEEAILSYDKGIQANPNMTILWSNRGNSLHNLGRYEDAIDSYNKGLQINPSDPMNFSLLDWGFMYLVWENRGHTLAKLSRYEEAIASYDRALQIKPDYHQAWYNRGIALGNLGRYEEAIASYDKALEIKPDYQEVWNNRGFALNNLGRYEEAIASYDKALQFNPDYYKTLCNRGFALVNLGKNEEAITFYEKALQLTDEISKKIEILQTISTLYYKLGKIREGIATTQRMTELIQDMNTPASEISTNPQWLRKLLKFGESGKTQGYILGASQVCAK